MRALRAYFSGMALAAMPGMFALWSVLLIGGSACAAENAADVPAVASAEQPDKNAAAVTSLSPSPGTAPTLSGENAATVPESAAPSLLLLSPIRCSSACPFAPLSSVASRECAEAAARMEALHAAAAALPDRRDIRMGLDDADARLALVAQLYTTVVSPEAGSAESSAAGGAKVVATLLARPDAAAEIALLLRNPELLSVRLQLLKEYEGLIGGAQEAVRLENEVVVLSGGRSQENVSPGAAGTWYQARVTPPGRLEQNPPLPVPADPVLENARAAAQNAAAALAERLHAASVAQDALRLSSEGWLASAEDLASLERAAAALPQSAGVRLLLAEAQLQAGLPQRSVDSCTEALRLAPDLNRARYIRALAHWRLQQLALAEDDLDAALEGWHGSPPQIPDQARRLRARGAVRMLRRDVTGMCADFSAACALGDCDGLAAARKQNFCLGENTLKEKPVTEPAQKPDPEGAAAEGKP